MSVFSGRAGRLAALGQAQTANDIYGRIAGAIGTGQSQALGALGAATPDRLAALRSGYDTATGYYNQARGEYAPYLPGAYASWNQMLDAAGVNGGGGFDRARSAFQASPGYQWQKEQATDEANRGAAAAGQLLSGNAISAIQDRASHLADQEFGSYYDRLQGASDRGQAAVGQVAGIDQALGGLAYGYGGDVSGVYGDVAGRAADIYGNTARLNAAALGNLGNQQITAMGAASEASQNAERNKLNLGLAALTALGNVGTGFAGALNRPKVG